MDNPLPITLLEDTVLSAPGSGAAVDVGMLRQVAKLRLDLVALTSGEELDVFVETSPAGVAHWSQVARRSLDWPGVHEVTVGPLQRFVRVRWSFSGGGAATLGVTAKAHVTYCTPRDIHRFSVPAGALDCIPLDEQLDACIAATDEADGYVGGAYKLPLKAWGDDLRKATARIAGADLLSARGIDPESQDAVVFQREEAAKEWLNRLANGRLAPPGMVDQTPETFEGGSVVVSRPKRGWW